MYIDLFLWTQIMHKKLLKSYKKFFDERLWNGTGIVALIAIMIVAVWITQSTSGVLYTKTNILEIQSTTESHQKNVITIDGKQYHVKNFYYLGIK